jgi:hypothetical protein
MGTMLILGAIVVVGTFLRSGSRLRTTGPGPERDGLVNSLWLVAGSAGIMLGVAMGVGPLAIPMPVQWVTMGVSVLLSGIGIVRTLRLVATQRQRLLAATESPVTLHDRIEALEVRKALHRGPPTRTRVFALGLNVILAGLFAWSASLALSSPWFALFGAATLAIVVLIGWDLLRMALARETVRQIDGEIAELLDAPQDGGKGRLEDGGRGGGRVLPFI